MCIVIRTRIYPIFHIFSGFCYVIAVKHSIRIEQMTHILLLNIASVYSSHFEIVLSSIAVFDDRITQQIFIGI